MKTHRMLDFLRYGLMLMLFTIGSIPLLAGAAIAITPPPLFPVPTGPGLGIEVNEEELTKKRFQFWEAPHLTRRDGSVTNW